MATFSLFFFCHLLHSLIEFEGSRSLEPGVSIGNGVSKWFCACCGCFTTRGTGTAFKERFVVYTLGLSQHQMEQVALDQVCILDKELDVPKSQQMAEQSYSPPY
ncbi:uncharacterized protein LOC144003821 isoform X4 [Festucalex cinctus]